MDIVAFFVVFYTIGWLLFTLWLWFVYLPRIKEEIKAEFKTGVLDGVLELLESDNKEDVEKIDDIIRYTTGRILKAVTTDEDAARFIKNYMNGISMAFVNIICARFNISPDEMKTLIQQIGGKVSADGKVDWMSMIQGEVLRNAPAIIKKGIEGFLE